MTSSESSVTPRPSARSLLTYISGRDELPIGRNLAKRARHGDGDIEDLQSNLEELYDIPTTSRRPHRNLSASSQFHTRQTTSKRRLKTAYGRPCTRITEFFSAMPMIAPSIPRLRNVFQESNMQQVVQPEPMLLLRLRWNDTSRFASEAGRLLGEVIDLACYFFGSLYTIFKRPLKYLVAISVVWIVGLNLFATIYTVTHESFLKTFCPKQLPVVRSLLCSSWDQHQSQRSSSADITAQPGLNLPFKDYLDDGNSTLSYELPYYLAHLESSIRAFRASLPESEYPQEEQQIFYKEFSTYIEHSDNATTHAQDFYYHIMNTIQLHVSDTNWLVRKLDSTGFSKVSVPVDGPLAKSMAFFQSYYMVYLINGIEPFRERGLQISLEATDLMRAHFSEMSERLLTAVRTIISLQQTLGDLSTDSEAIQKHISRCTADDKMASRNRSRSWAYLTRTLLWRTQSQYQMDQQRQWLEDLQSVVKYATAFLTKVAKEFDIGRRACLSLVEQLADQGQGAKAGWSVSNWVHKQAEELSSGIEDIEFQLKNFKVEKMRFNDNVFPHRREAAKQEDTGNQAKKIFKL